MLPVHLTETTRYWFVFPGNRLLSWDFRPFTDLDPLRLRQFIPRLLEAPSTGDAVARARQNVIFELGYFVGKIGRSRVRLLCKGAVEIPSDLLGVIYKRMDDGGGWKHELMKEPIAAEMPSNPYTI